MDDNKLSKIIMILVLSVIIVAIFLLLTNNEDTAKLELIGQSKITINQYSQYKEPGYNIIGDESKGFYVNIDGKVDSTIPGTYQLKYLLYNKNGTLVSTTYRDVIVVEYEDNISIYLNGDDEEYYFVNDYVDFGAEAYENGEDISSRIKVKSEVNASKVGVYYVHYVIELNGKEKEVVRKVHIIDYEIKEEIDYNRLEIELLIKCDDYDYTLLPNKQKEYGKDVTYLFDDTDTFVFDIYLKSGSHKKYLVTIDEIDKNGPVGSCTIEYNNNKTSISIEASDESSISKYSYNGLEFYENKKIIDSIATNVTIRAYDKWDNYTDIKCKAILGNGFRNININNRGRVQDKSGYITCNTSVSKENNELDLLMQSYGYKTREAVVAAAVYLATYKYDIPYSWGGKYFKKGFNPEWGCSKKVYEKKCTKELEGEYCELGLDCTGLTSWAFIQAGFDSSIIRDSSQSEGKWGNFSAKAHRYSFGSNNRSLADLIKPGDLVHREGHVGLVIGTDKDKIQIVEMLGPIYISTLDKNTGKSLNGQEGFTDFVLFDDFYKEYGNS